jgi:hypothetical protein
MAIHLKTSIKKVLSTSSEPMDIDQIAVQLAIEEDLSRHGAVPLRSVHSCLENAVREDGDGCQFIKTATGHYMLRAKASPLHLLAARKASANVNKSDVDASGIFTCYGLNWQRKSISWTPAPEIMGCQFQESVKVNFTKQIGLYALQNTSGDVEFIGHTIQKPIGSCLYDHTRDRLTFKWEQFSFFGLLPVNDRGYFGRLPDDFTAADSLTSIKAITVELARPRSNRKIFDWFSVLEFNQWQAPAFEFGV